MRTTPSSAWLICALARYLAKPVKHASVATTAELQTLATVLQPGDVLLTDGNTRMAALVRRLTKSNWSHVSMYVGPLTDERDPPCIVEADVAAGVRALPLSELNGLRVRVLRHTGLLENERRHVADWVVGQIGGAYDVAHAWNLARRLLRLPITAGLDTAPSTMTQEAKRFICTSLLAHAFLLVGHPITSTQLRDRALSAVDHSYLTPPDFESASAFEVVQAAQPN